MLKTLQNHIVFRYATIYAIAGWLLIQFADISLEAFDAPAWVMRTFLVIVLIGFPVTLMVSWLANRASVTGRANSLIALCSIIAALSLSAMAFRYWSVEPTPEAKFEAAESLVERAVEGRQENPTIAILPFDNMSGVEENEYLADGMVEDVITLLSQSPGVQVVARNSTFKYKGTNPDVRDVGSDLGADYVVEGSLRPMGERLRVTIQVIDSKTGAHVWAEKYDQPMAGFFDLQDDVTLGIAAAVGDAVFRTEYQAINQSRTENMSAWSLVSQVEKSFNTAAVGPATIENARRAIALDPGYALAHAAFARTLALHTLYFTSEPLEGNANLLEAEASARRAHQLAPNDPKVQNYLAITLQWSGKTEEALVISRRVPKMSPSYAQGIAYLGDILVHNNLAEESIPQIKKAMRLTPNSPQLGMYSIFLAEAYIQLGDWAQAESAFTDALRHYGGTHEFSQLFGAAVKIQLGKHDEAREMYRAVLVTPNSQPLARQREVLEFYTVPEGRENFVKILDDLEQLEAGDE